MIMVLPVAPARTGGCSGAVGSRRAMASSDEDSSFIDGLSDWKPEVPPIAGGGMGAPASELLCKSLGVGFAVEKELIAISKVVAAL